ncbi:hypothetical protein HNR46_004109 [Haloferula luteola]|uniref:Uncharacterized protein n=1 Tax=Haloferula luteola TaxID=595692 RepID=A0A840V745_9BACT|nr:hypothetical protein [Haloferula luteola]MBB5353845.1 hypothetical protein [Haloferula luteola]
MKSRDVITLLSCLLTGAVALIWILITDRRNNDRESPVESDTLETNRSELREPHEVPGLAENPFVSKLPKRVQEKVIAVAEGRSTYHGKTEKKVFTILEPGLPHQLADVSQRPDVRVYGLMYDPNFLTLVFWLPFDCARYDVAAGHFVVRDPTTGDFGQLKDGILFVTNRLIPGSYMGEELPEPSGTPESPPRELYTGKGEYSEVEIIIDTSLPRKDTNLQNRSGPAPVGHFLNQVDHTVISAPIEEYDTFTGRILLVDRGLGLREVPKSGTFVISMRLLPDLMFGEHDSYFTRRR